MSQLTVEGNILSYALSVIVVSITGEFNYMLYMQDFEKKLSSARRVVVVGNGGIATEIV